MKIEEISTSRERVRGRSTHLQHINMDASMILTMTMLPFQHLYLRLALADQLDTAQRIAGPTLPRAESRHSQSSIAPPHILTKSISSINTRHLQQFIERVVKTHSSKDVEKFRGQLRSHLHGTCSEDSRRKRKSPPPNIEREVLTPTDGSQCEKQPDESKCPEKQRDQKPERVKRGTRCLLEGVSLGEDVPGALAQFHRAILNS